MSHHSKFELCSSLCSCPLLVQLHENFVKKFRVYPNQNCGNSTFEPSEINVAPYFNTDSICEIEPGEECAANMLVEKRTKTLEAVPSASTSSTGNDEDAIVESLDYEILDEDSQTPVPIYELMSESELNTELAKYGHGPVGRKAAIKLLAQIYEATHPVLSQNTPISRKIARAFALNAKSNAANCQANRQKRARNVIAKLIGPENIIIGTNEEKVAHFSCETDKQEQSKIILPLRQSFLAWLRKPGNEKLYNDLLFQNPVLLDNLYTTFKQEVKDVKLSREDFVELLDKLGITFCPRNLVENQQI